MDVDISPVQNFNILLTSLFDIFLNQLLFFHWHLITNLKLESPFELRDVFPVFFHVSIFKVFTDVFVILIKTLKVCIELLLDVFVFLGFGFSSCFDNCHGSDIQFDFLVSSSLAVSFHIYTWSLFKFTVVQYTNQFDIFFHFPSPSSISVDGDDISFPPIF